jgi:hypothetical protein
MWLIELWGDQADIEELKKLAEVFDCDIARYSWERKYLPLNAALRACFSSSVRWIMSVSITPSPAARPSRPSGAGAA